MSASDGADISELSGGAISPLGLPMPPPMPPPMPVSIPFVPPALRPSSEQVISIFPSFIVRMDLLSIPSVAFVTVISVPLRFTAP